VTEVAFPGHVAEVPAPLQQIHLDGGRVRELDEEDPVGRNGADRVRVELASQGVETVEDQADGRVVGAADDLPGVAVVVDVAAPG
jgi:hypothetical protein